MFFGDVWLFDQSPVTLGVTLPGGKWQMAAIPVGGWGQSGMGVGLIRLMGLLAGLAASILAYRLSRGAQALANQGARCAPC